MNQRRIEVAAKCAVYRDISRRLFDAGFMNQAMFEFFEAEIQRLERMPIHGDEAESPAPARNVTIIEPTATEN